MTYYATLPPLAEADGADAALPPGAEALHLWDAGAVGAVFDRGSTRDDLGRQRHGADQEHEREFPDGGDRLVADPHAGKDVRVMADSLYGLEIYSEDLYSSGELNGCLYTRRPDSDFYGGVCDNGSYGETRRPSLRLFLEYRGDGACTSKHTTEG